MLAEYNTGKYHNLELGEGIYKVPSYSTFRFANGILFRVYGVPNKSALKFWKENTAEVAPEVIDISNNESIYIQDVDFLAPEKAILTSVALSYRLFKGLKNGSNDIDNAPCVAIVNNKGGFGLGIVNFSGIEKPITLLSRPAYGFIYLENFHVKGISITSLNCNWSGGGTYFGTENCTIYTGRQDQYAVNSVKFPFSLKEDAETLTILGKDTDSTFWPTREAYTGRSSVFQVEGKDGDRFIFILPNKLQIQTYLQQINDRPASGLIPHETKTDKMLCGHIPRVGDVVTLQREYVTNLFYDDMNGYPLPDPSKADFKCGALGPAVRSHIAYTTTEQVYGTSLKGKRQNGVYLQVGDVLLNKQTNVLHNVVKIRRGDYTVGWGTPQSGYSMEYKPFASYTEAKAAGMDESPDVFVYQNYVLDPPLQDDAPMLNTFEVVASRALYLLEGEYVGEIGWMSNAQWAQNRDQYLTPSTSVVAHTFYNMRELNHDHRNSDYGDVADGTETDYRENNMNYAHIGGKEFTLKNGMVVKSLAAYPYFGSQHVDTKVFGGNQYGGGYDKFMPQRAAILADQEIEEEYACMQRNIGNVNQGRKVTDPQFYTTEELRPRPARLLEFLKQNRR